MPTAYEKKKSINELLNSSYYQDKIERKRKLDAYSVAYPKRSAKGVIPSKLRKKTQPCNPHQN